MPVMLLTPKTMNVIRALGCHVILHMVLFLATKILFLAIMEKKRALIMSTPEIHVEANFLPRSDQQGNSFYSMLSIVSSKKI